MSNTADFAMDYAQKQIPGLIMKLGLALFVVGALLCALAFGVDSARASFNLIISFMFVFSIGVGSLFLVALEYLVGAVWSVPMRRISEFLAILLFVTPILAVPVLLNLHEVFHWTHPEAVATDELLQHKKPYLNTNFFVLRYAGILVIMALFYFALIGNSKKQDKDKDQKHTKNNTRYGAIFMPFFAVCVTVLAIDWMMSLEPHWFSTIFGVYYFSGTVLAALSALTLIVVILYENNYLPWATRDHLYSLGALLFAFINFWAYIAFSQYMLIWYANLPEETFWFMQRGQGSWLWVSLGLIVIHFVIPYAALVSQSSKSSPKMLKTMSIWILFAHLYDLYWLIMPTYSQSSAIFGWIEIVFILMTAGLLIFIFSAAARNKNLIPIGDPKLKRGLEFHL